MDLGSGAIGLGPRQVDVRAIEEELDQLWRERSAAAGDTPVTRACVLNLVVYAGSAEEAERAREAIEGAASHDPCRAIVITAEPAGVPGLDAWVGGRCHLSSPGAPQICCEEINLRAGGSELAQLPGLVLSLLVPDLPIVLWWVDEPAFDSPVFRRLAGVADRVVVDSSSFADPEAALVDLAGWTAQLRRRAAVGDLAWRALAPWRESLARLFDPQAARSWLARLDSVSVDHRLGEGSSLSTAQAMLLAGWLASRLGWKNPEPQAATLDGLACRLSRPGGVVEVSIHRASGERASVRLEVRGEQLTASVVEQEDRTLLATSELPDSAAEAFAGPSFAASDAELLCRELESLDRDRIFEEALVAAALLVEGFSR